MALKGWALREDVTEALLFWAKQRNQSLKGWIIPIEVSIFTGHDYRGD